jgi:hypothetical protein
MKTYLRINLEFSNDYYDRSIKDSNIIETNIDPFYVLEDSSFSTYFDSNNQYDIIDGDKLYFLPGVSIPRIKLKNLNINNKVKTVRDITQANAVFFSKNTLGKITDRKWFYTIKTENFKTLVESAKDKFDAWQYSNLTAALEFYDTSHILCDYNTKMNVIKTLKENCTEVVFDDLEYKFNNGYSQGFDIVDSKFTDVVKQLPNLSLYPEESLIKHLNGDDAIEITEELFESLKDMFKSSDSDNHVLAMEIMANSNYNGSLIYLELLFHKYWNVIDRSNTKTHVNFKSLLSFLGKKRSLHTDHDDIMNSLIKHEQLNETNLNILIQNTIENLYSPFSSSYFKIASVTMNEDVLKKLNTNFIYKTSEDFIPEPEVIEPVLEPSEDDMMLYNHDDTALGEVMTQSFRDDLVYSMSGVVVSEDEVRNASIDEVLQYTDVAEKEIEHCIDDIIIQYTDPAGNTFEAPVVAPCVGHDAETIKDEELILNEFSALDNEFESLLTQEEDDTDFKL